MAGGDNCETKIGNFWVDLLGLALTRGGVGLRWPQRNRSKQQRFLQSLVSARRLRRSDGLVEGAEGPSFRLGWRVIVIET